MTEFGGAGRTKFAGAAQEKAVAVAVRTDRQTRVWDTDMDLNAHHNPNSQRGSWVFRHQGKPGATP